MINIIDKETCCGCSACVQKCPKNCIVLKEDVEGFLYPKVNQAECIDCGLCEKVCLSGDNIGKIQPEEVLAVKTFNDAERMESSSGGVFVALAKFIIARGGVVFGAVFNKHWEVIHTYTETIEGIRPMMGSKYMQSQIGNSFQDAEKFLKAGKIVLFSGSPCQITGLHNYLQKEYPNLLTVDFLCHGVPSPSLWRKYLNELYCQLFRKKFERGKEVSSFLVSSMISRISFRDKKFSGWKKYNFVIWGKSVPPIRKNIILLVTKHYKNIFMRGFLANLYLRPSCYHCKYKNGISHSDLTIADYWGIDKLMPDFDDDKGVGLLLLNTSKGKEIFDHLKMDVRQSSIEIAKQLNPGFKEVIPVHPKRNEFFRNISMGKSFTESVNLALYIPVYKKALNKINRIVKKLLNKTVKV